MTDSWEEAALEVAARLAAHSRAEAAAGLALERIGRLLDTHATDGNSAVETLEAIWAVAAEQSALVRFLLEHVEQVGPASE